MAPSAATTESIEKSFDEVAYGAPRVSTPERLTGRVARELRRALIDRTGEGDNGVADLTAKPQDKLSAFNPLITAARLATTAISILLATNNIFERDSATVLATAVIIIYATMRSLEPIRYRGDFASLANVLFELLVHIAIVDATGLWSSPFTFSLITPVIVAGFARGFGFAFRVALTASVAVSIPHYLLNGGTQESLQIAMTWSGMLLLIAIVSGFGRAVSGEADRERDLALDRLGRLADANALLYSLHKVAQTLPQSLDMADVLDSTVTRLKSLVAYDFMLIMLFDETDGQWEVVRQEGYHVPARLGATELPASMRRAIAENRVVATNEFTEESGRPFDNRSGSGLYGVLSARGSIMGLIALENRKPHRFDHRDGGLLNGFIPPLALALDNARWFARLRTVGADEERTRIARDLHDRIGQSLAYLAFEMDRIVSREEANDDIGDALVDLRGDIRSVIGEVRDTLYDLRTDVTEESSFEETVREYVERVASRAELRFDIDASSDHRLPILQEREMWRIAQEAITNIERHAQATSVELNWRCRDGRAALQVIDDGLGFEIGRAGRLDSYGMLGMRERASSIGATLDVRSQPGNGTSITCVLDPSAQEGGKSRRGKEGTYT